MYKRQILITVRSVSQPIVKLAAEVRATDPAAPARLQKTDITELDALAGSIETLSDEVLRAGGKFTQILEMASVRMGGFEVDGRDGTLFLTDQFFDVFGRPELASTVRGPQSFERAMDALHVYVTEREKTDDEHTEYIFRMPEPDGVRWVRMRLLRSSSRWTGLAEDIKMCIRDSTWPGTRCSRPLSADTQAPVARPRRSLPSALRDSPSPVP